MKKPKFLQNFQTKKQKIRQLETNLKRATSLLNDYEERNRNLKKENDAYFQKETRRKMEEAEKERKRTDPFSADKWRVVYDSHYQVSKVYFNGQEIHGCQRFDIDFDSLCEGQTPRFTFEGYGSIDIVSEDRILEKLSEENSGKESE